MVVYSALLGTTIHIIMLNLSKTRIGQTTLDSRNSTHEKLAAGNRRRTSKEINTKK